MTPGDEHFYAQVAVELETEQLDQDTWTKALEQNGFDEKKARAAYVMMRVDQLTAEVQMRVVEGRREAKREVNRERLERAKPVVQFVLIILIGGVLFAAFLVAVF